MSLSIAIVEHDDFHTPWQCGYCDRPLDFHMGEQVGVNFAFFTHCHSGLVWCDDRQEDCMGLAMVFKPDDADCVNGLARE